MTTLVYNHKEKTAQILGTNSKGLLGFDKADKTFCCEASDLDCAGMKNIPQEFKVMIAENGHTKDFSYKATKHTNDEDYEVISWLYQSRDGFNFVIFND